ncbi:MAG: glutamyl-tRNA reductase [Thermodesulfobacteriota bacterium]
MPTLADHLMVLGVNHKVAPVDVREKLAFPQSCGTVLMEILSIPGCGECVFLSTCNRVEVYFVTRDPEATAKNVRGFLFSQTGLSDDDARKYSYLHVDEGAVHHTFRVAASLDSMIVGEPQILGQLKTAYRNATETKTTGIFLNRLFDKAFSVAKRIRTETNIGGSAVSISYAAVQLAKKIFGDLAGKTVLLAGAGEMAELAAEHLLAQGIREIIVANRTLERAVKLAKQFNGRAVALSELVEQLEYADILISSTGAPDLILKKEDVKPVMRQRMNSPLFLIDIAVPRDLDPRLNDLDNVYLYDIDNLKDVVEVNKAEREKEAEKAERIVGEEKIKFLQWLSGMEIAPTIKALQKKANEIRVAELERTLARMPDLSERDRKSLEAMTGAIVSKLLHNPISYLKGNTGGDNKDFSLDQVRTIFGLGEDGDGQKP